MNVAAASVLLLTSCFEQASENIEVLDDSTKTSLKVTTRAAQGEIAYPVLVMAYDATGNLTAQQTLTDETQNISLQLSEGRYHITALSGEDAYVAPKNHDLMSSQVTLPQDGYATAPLMMGGADVVVGNVTAEVNLVMTYRVAGLNLSLSDLPQEVTGVTVSVSQQYNALDMTGGLSGKSIATIACQKSGDLWKSPETYLLPGAGQTTTLTLTLTRSDGQTSYSYELGEALEASVPYRIEGHYVEAMVPYITGVLTVEGWRDERKLSFDFGNGSQGSAGHGTNVPTLTENTLPQQGMAWNGHVVALVENATETEAEVLLMSLAEFYDVYAPAASGHTYDMQNLANAYAEAGMEGWSVPTEEQARALRKEYGGKFEDLNGVIELLGGTAITISGSSNNARYLCAEGAKTYNFAENGSITSAGTSVKYRLRLVKKVHVVVE